MTILDTRARATVLRLLQKYGKSITYTSVADGVYDPASGTTSAASLTFTLKAMVEDYTFRSSGGSFDRGDLVRHDDKRATIAASGLTFTPKAGDRVTVDGVDFVVANVKPNYSGERVASWDVHIRE